MVEFGYYVSLEHTSPEAYVTEAVAAEQAGFTTIWAADHFHPWFDTLPDGTSAHAADCWSWLPVALERTDSVRIGTGGTALLHRHHPADIAHRLATLANIYSGRVFTGVGTGEALNELPLGYPWPEYSERAKRTAEGIRLIKQLFEAEYVDYDGEFWSLESANLYTGPDITPPIYVAAGGSTSARMAGELGDGFMTVYRDPDHVREQLIPSLKRGIEKSDTNDSIDDLDKMVLLNCSYAGSEKAALEACKPYRSSLLPVFFDLGIADPQYIQSHGEMVGIEQLKDEFLVATQADDFIEAAEAYVDIGFDQIIFHSCSPNQDEFIEMIRDEVLPEFS